MYLFIILANVCFLLVIVVFFYNHIIKLTEFIEPIFFFCPLKIISLSSIFLCWKKYDLAKGVAQGQKLTYELNKKIIIIVYLHF